MPKGPWVCADVCHGNAAVMQLAVLLLGGAWAHEREKGTAESTPVQTAALQQYGDSSSSTTTTNNTSSSHACCTQHTTSHDTAFHMSCFILAGTAAHVPAASPHTTAPRHHHCALLRLLPDGWLGPALARASIACSCLAHQACKVTLCGVLFFYYLSSTDLGVSLQSHHMHQHVCSSHEMVPSPAQ